MKFSVSAATALLALLLPLSVHAWYLQVHNQIAYLAESFLNEPTRYFIGQILEPEYRGSIGRAAAWADTVKRGGLQYSFIWHFTSALDNPPNACGLYYHRDCQQGGCLVQQVMNQTSILRRCLTAVRDGRYSPDVDCQQSLKWIVHFLGDVHQPLHSSERGRGGNDVKVTFNGYETNMHQTWDRWILYTLANRPDGFSDQQIDPYFAGLESRIRADQFREPTNTWDPCNWQVSRDTYCPEKWAQQSNAIVCDYVYGRFTNASVDLWPDYTKGAFHIVEMQLAKAAWRLAGWLNTLAAIHFGPTDDVLDNPGLYRTTDDLVSASLGEWASLGPLDGLQQVVKPWTS